MGYFRDRKFMRTPALKRLAAGLAVSLFASNLVYADTVDADEIILPTELRFSVFELSSWVGNGTFAGPVGTVLLSFVSRDQRYCRSARLSADRNVVLACREEAGWRIEAASSDMREVSEAVEALRAGVNFLDGHEINEATAKNWLNPEPLDDQTFSARDILGRTAAVYMLSKSYIDSGVVKTMYRTKSGERKGETRFKTAYRAPHDFRFESNMNDFGTIEVGFIVARDKNGVEAWLSSNPDLMDDVASIQEALDGGAGVSRDASGMVPGLIFRGTKLGGDIVRIASPVRLDDAHIDGFDCFQLQGFRWPNTGQPTTVWIDKEGFLIRRVYEEQELKGVAMRTTWFYKPALNSPVDDDALRFGKPSL